MKKVINAAFILAMAFSVVFIGEISSARAQSMQGTISATKHKTYRGGRYVAHKTVRGTRWTAHKAKRGTKWTFHKTKHGTKWTAHTTKVKTKHIFHKTKDALN